MRQGFPKSSLLVIEVLAIEDRPNPNTAGFKTGREKIASVSYMDDMSIVIKQNPCFKEVMNQLELYEETSNARINYNEKKVCEQEVGMADQ